MLHVTNALHNLPSIDVECADGNWDFIRDTENQTLTRTIPNPNGDSEMSYVSTYGGVTYACYTPMYYEDAAWGDSEDAFDLSFNNVFSPVSNPRSTNGGSVEFSLEVTGSNQITLYFDGDGSGDEYEGTPSKPQNLQISWQNNHPRLDWDANTEPDLDVYNIYKKRGAGSYSFLNSTSNSYYVDNTEFQYSGYPETKIYVYYKITAEDTQDKESVASNEVKGAVNQDIEKRAAENNEEKEKFNYMLSEIYPNPFNSSTTISYSLPADGHVQIKVYDLLGREIAELFNGPETAGYHNIVFDAGNLSSGMYIVNMNVNGSDGKTFNQSRKILLMK